MWWRELVDQAEIHRKSRSKKISERIDAVKQLSINFAVLPDKKQAWNDIHQLTQDVETEIIPEKGIWQKSQAKRYPRPYRLLKIRSVRRHAAESLGVVFPYIPDKEQAWQDLLLLMYDEDIGVQWRAVESLGVAFPHIPNKKQAGEKLHQLAQEGNSDVRWSVSGALGAAFSYILDKKQAWEDLLRLMQNKHKGVQYRAIESLGTVFPHIHDKEHAWNELLLLTHVKERNVGWCSVVLGVAFPSMPDKKQAWNDLLLLTKDDHSDVQQGGAGALGSAFLHISDKEHAWNDLLLLTKHNDSYVRWHAVDALRCAYSYMPDKEQAWNDLHQLTCIGYRDVRQGTTESFGAVFAHIPDKEQAWNDLLLLTQDSDGGMRVSANHSLGGASIFRATEAESEEEFGKELEKALCFFEKASTEATYINPAKFCLPFYRSFYALTFKKQEAKAEVQRYLAEAKSATGGSKNKEQLLEAIENLAEALKEVHDLRETDFDIMKRDLNAYRQYCDRAAELIGAAEEETPGAARVLRRGLPIIDERIKEVNREIQERARAVCKLTQDTALEDLGAELNREGKNLLEIRDPIGLGKSFDSLHFILSEMCARIPEDKRGFACKTLEKAKNEPFVEDLIDLINIVLGSMQSAIGEIKTLIKIGKIEKSTGVQIGGEGNVQQIDVMSGVPAQEHDKHKFTLREIVYGAIIDIAIHALVIISIDHYLESSMDKIAPYLIITFVIVLVITIFALRKLPTAKSS